MPKSPPAYDYYNPSTWLVAPEDVEEEEDTSIAAQNARAEAAAELSAAAALEASKTDDVFAKFAMKIQRADEKEEEEEREYMEQHQRQQERHGRHPFVPHEASITGDRKNLVHDRDNVTKSSSSSSSGDAGAGLRARDRDRASTPPELQERVHTPPRCKPQPDSSLTPSASAVVTVSAAPVAFSAPASSSTSSPSGELKLPNRQPKFRTFADEEPPPASNTGYGYGENNDEERERDGVEGGNWLDDDGNEGFPGELNPPRMQRMRRDENGTYVRQEGISDLLIPPTIAEQREINRIKKAQSDAGKHKLQFIAVDHGTQGGLDHAAMVERMLYPAQIPVPAPPQDVGALGKDSCAAVWWAYDRENSQIESWVTSWEVRRYRLDKDNQWRYKGSTIINEPHLIGKNRITVLELENNCQYRFSVIGTNMRGTGFESAQSTPIMVEASLPPGWFRFWDESLCKFFYSNIKTKTSSWTRPELDPWFLDESVVLLFSRDELAHLRELFEEEMGHFGRITAIGLRRMMLECGEAIGMNRCIMYITSCLGRETANKWSEFMLVISTVKKRCQHRDRSSTCWGLINCTCGLPCYCYQEVLSASLTTWRLYALIGTDTYHETQKIGNWKVEWSDMAERFFYTNVITHDHQWDTPEEVRFYMPTKMEEQLLQYFNEGDIQDFRVRFAHLDVDNSGSIDEHEFKLLLESMGTIISDRHRRKLIKEIDINGNGTIEFHEFCFMMLQLHKQKNGASSIWDQIKILSDDKTKLQQVTNEIVEKTQIEEEFGNRKVDLEHSTIQDRIHAKELAESLKEESEDDKRLREIEAIRKVEIATAKKRQEASEAGSFQNMLAEIDANAKGVAKESKWETHVRKEAEAKKQAELEELLAGSAEEQERMSQSQSARGGGGGGGGGGEDRAYAKLQLKRMQDLGIGGKKPTRDASHFSALARFHHLSRPMNPDEVEKIKEKKEKEKVRLPNTGVSYVERMTRKEKKRLDDIRAAQKPNILQLLGSVIWATSIGLVITVGKCVLNTKETTEDIIDKLDSCMDVVACKSKSGPHGRHCFCGCRMMMPEDVTYPFWSDSRQEPLSWGLIIPCLDK